jgi:hypothetical protein
LFAVNKARLGGVFYNVVATRADPLVDRWKRETEMNRVYAMNLLDDILVP